jgi:hypothetical protein
MHLSSARSGQDIHCFKSNEVRTVSTPDAGALDIQKPMHKADWLLRRWLVVLCCVVSVLSVDLPWLCLGRTDVGGNEYREFGKMRN